MRYRLKVHFPTESSLSLCQFLSAPKTTTEADLSLSAVMIPSPPCREILPWRCTAPSFLFLTMEPSPEARRISSSRNCQELSLSRRIRQFPSMSAASASKSKSPTLEIVPSKSVPLSIDPCRSLTSLRLQVGSHYHFTEVNRALKFDRSLSFFRRLDIAAGTAVRFEPGDTKTVTLVDIAGKQIVSGGSFLVNSAASELATSAQRDECLRRLIEKGFGHEEQKGAVIDASGGGEILSRESYNSMYGPTKGDRVRLGDTELWIEVEDDRTVYGDELKFGGGRSESSR